MSPHEQSRQPSGVPTGGRWATSPHAEPAVVLHDEVRYLSFLAGELSDPYTAASMSPNIVADFARRVLPFLTNEPDAPTELPVAPAPRAQIAGKLGMMASCREATDEFDLPVGTKWAKVRDGDNGPLEWTIVADPSSAAADYTLSSRENLTETIKMATLNSAQLARPQTIDYPGDESWLRLTVTADGAFHGARPISPPYWAQLTSLAADVPAEELVAAAAWINANPDANLCQAAFGIADQFHQKDRARAMSILTSALSQDLHGRAGVVRAVLALTKQSTPGYRDLLDAARPVMP